MSCEIDAIPLDVARIDGCAKCDRIHQQKMASQIAVLKDHGAKQWQVNFLCKNLIKMLTEKPNGR